jgi:regulator of RNase E activity RraB
MVSATMTSILRHGLLLLPVLLLAAGCDDSAPDTPVTQPPQTAEPVTEPSATPTTEESTMPDDANADPTPGEQNTYFTADAHAKNVEKQTNGAAQILAQMRKGGITADREFALDIFFYTDNEEKVSKLAAALTDKGYSVKHGPSASDPKVFSVTGQTTQMKMDEPIVVDWAREMCELGFRHDCEFDGWGVNPKQ